MGTISPEFKLTLSGSGFQRNDVEKMMDLMRKCVGKVADSQKTVICQGIQRVCMAQDQEREYWVYFVKKQKWYNFCDDVVLQCEAYVGSEKI